MPKPEHLSQKDTDDILRFITLARSHLRLDQWDIILMLEPPDDDDAIMDVTPTENHYSTQIRVSKEWPDLPDAVKKDTVVHELIHLLHRDLNDLINDMTYGDSSSSQDNTNACQGAYMRIVERMVSQLTRTIADGWEQEWPAPSKTVVGKGIYIQGEHR